MAPREEGDAIAEMLNELSAERGAESCAESDSGCQAALDEVESSGGASSVCDYEDGDDTKDCICNAIEQLDRDQALWVEIRLIAASYRVMFVSSRPQSV